MELKIKAVHPKMGKDFPLPKFATPGSAAMDLLACIDSPVTLAPGARQTVPTGRPNSSPMPTRTAGAG